MQTLYEYIAENPIVYVTRDIERALGIPFSTPGYFVVTNESALAEKYMTNEVYTGKICVVKNPAERPYDTYELLQLQEVKTFLSQNAIRKVLVFKNTEVIEQICKDNNWELLNPSATIAKQVEEKISQVEWLGELQKYLPTHEITVCKHVRFSNEPMVLQFNYGHTGSGTFIIESEAQLNDIQQKFPDRPVRKGAFINGPVFTCNIVVASKGVLEGNVSYQITGLPPFTTNRFSTIGNDWSLPYRILSPEQFARFSEIAQSIGKKLASQNWAGLFGIDCILDTQSGMLYLLEINARQPASTSYESQLQRGASMEGTTLFEAHLATLLKQEQIGDIIRISDGAQIVQRVTENIRTIDPEKVNNLVQDDFTVIGYGNTELNADLVRVQSQVSLMASHGILNDRGQQIATLLSA